MNKLIKALKKAVGKDSIHCRHCRIFLRLSILGNFQIFLVPDQGKCAALIDTISVSSCCCFCFFMWYQEKAKYLPDKNCISCSRHKIVLRLAYFGVKMTSLFQEHKTVRKAAYLGKLELCISFKDIKSSGK